MLLSLETVESLRSVSGCSIVSPRASAVSFTLLIVRSRPLPEGRSGLVRTNITSCPSSTIAFRAATAKAGVPAKMMRIRRKKLVRWVQKMLNRAVAGLNTASPALQSMKPVD